MTGKVKCCQACTCTYIDGIKSKEAFKADGNRDKNMFLLTKVSKQSKGIYAFFRTERLL